MKLHFTPPHLNSKGLSAVILVFLMFLSFFTNAQNPTVIMDSLVVMQRVYAKEKLIVDQEAKFKQDIKVLGSARIQTDLRVDSTLRVDGTAKFFSNVKMPNLAVLVNLNNPDLEIVLKAPSGDLKSITWSNLKSVILEEVYKQDCSVGDIEHPIWVNGLNKIFSLCPQVNVGIGTGTPQYKLDVRGTTFSTKILAGNLNAPSNAMINGYAPSASWDLMQLGVKISGGTESVRFSVSNAGNIIATNIGNQPTLTINNGTGHAAVIYANNGNKILQLEDNGMLRAREIKVDQNTWADYVFDKNYKLPSLKNVAQYITKNHHLPGVPSAKEIEADGLNLGDMQNIQMQKIEELTLYMIEMDEKMTAMEKRMNELEKENGELNKNKQ